MKKNTLLTDLNVIAKDCKKLITFKYLLKGFRVLTQAL